MLERLEDRLVMAAGALPTLAPLVQFSSQDAFSKYFLDQAVARNQALFGTPAASPDAGSSFLQGHQYLPGDAVEGNNVGDIIASNGDYLFQLTSNQLIVMSTHPDGVLGFVSSVNVAFTGNCVAEFLLGNRLVVISTQIMWQFQPTGPNGELTTPDLPPSTEVAVYDVSNPATPKLVQDDLEDGAFGGAHVFGDRLYVVLQSSALMLPTPAVVEDGHGGFMYETQTQYEARLLPRVPDLILPRSRPTALSGVAADSFLSQPADVYQSRIPNVNLFESVLTFDVSAEGNGLIDAQTMMGNFATTVYAANDHLYLASTDWVTNGSDSPYTDSQRIDLNESGAVPGPAALVSGELAELPGEMDEFNGDLRIATRGTGLNSSSNIFVVRQDGDHLGIVGSLTDIDPGAQLGAVRFVGDRAYLGLGALVAIPLDLVDPFAVVDLSNPASPRLVGQVALPGQLTGLYPLDANHVLGVVNLQARYSQSLQLALFDVSDITQPRIVGTYTIDGAPPPDASNPISITTADYLPGFDVNQSTATEAAYTTQAFSYQPDQQLIALPVTGTVPYRGYANDPSSQLFVFHVDPVSGFELRGQITHDTQVRRSIFQDGFLYSIADGSTQVHSLSDLGGPGEEVRANDVVRQIRYLQVQLQPGQDTPVSLMDFLVTDPTGLDPMVHWGDGVISPATLMPIGDGRYSVVAQHAYGVLGSYSAFVTFERDGQTEARLNTTVQVGSLDVQSEFFIRRLFLDLLNRVVDPGALNNLGGDLAQGWSRDLIAQSVVRSPEYQSGQIENLYKYLLHRPADDAGKQAWLSYLTAGNSIDDVRAGILGSEEFFANTVNGNSAAFIETLYNDVLARPADPAGSAAWQSFVQLGVSRFDLVKAFLRSAEAARREVYDQFAAFLHRIPEEGGLSFFSQAIEGGASSETIAAAILGSPEYLQISN